MPVSPTYPGVYIEEVPSGVRTIVGVATSIAAFVDFFPRGPMNRAVEIFSFGDFAREFGGLDARSEAGYAIQQFFLNGGAQAWVVRVASEDMGHPLAVATVPVLSAGMTSSLTIRAANEGSWGNRLLVQVDYNTSDPAARFNLVISETAIVNGRTVITRQESYRELSMAAADVNYVAAVVNAASVLVTVADPGTAGPMASGTLSGGAITFPVPEPATGALQLEVTFTIGAVTDTRTASLGPGEITSLEQAAARLEAAIHNANPGDAAWAQARVRAVADRLQITAGPSAPNAVVSFGPVMDDTHTADNLNLDAPASKNVAFYRLGAPTVMGTGQGVGAPGADGLPPDVTALIGSQAADPPTGLFALDKVSLFNILCLPRVARVSGTTHNFPQAQVAAAIDMARAYCEARRAFFVLDTPNNVVNVVQVKEWLKAHATLRHRNLALYFPRVEVADPLNGFQLRSFGASGTIAGLYARTDAARGVWKAPAGTEASLRNVSRLQYFMTDPENGTLNPLGINCLRDFPVYGMVSWGARTLEGSDQQASDWKYVPVRRLTLFLEETLYRGTQWVVFEPNDEPLWAQIRLNIGAFMHSLFRQGAFQGQSPREAYLVKCDKETTTQDDINKGIVNIVVGFAPLKPAEFVIIKIQQLAGQIPT